MIQPSEREGRVADETRESGGLRPFDAVFAVAMLAGAIHFGWSAVQGDHGVFARLQIEADARELEADLAALRAERARLENLTRRLSTAYLDLDLLDERARAVLGHMRPDEITPR
jgi:cell division protein FtsB